jgi:F0F1-type ATP synthase assembly protein I
MKEKRTDQKVFQSLSLIIQFGIYMLVPICGMGALGYWLDLRFGTKWIVILFFFLGAIAGFQNVFRLAMKITEKPVKEPERNILNRRKEDPDEQDPGDSEKQE